MTLIRTISLRLRRARVESLVGLPPRPPGAPAAESTEQIDDGTYCAAVYVPRVPRPDVNAQPPASRGARAR